MHDTGKVVTGLVIFLAVATSPMWYHLAKGAEFELPEPRIAGEEHTCVAARPYMRAFHMDLLNEWRNDVVRGGNRTHVGPDGKEYDKSLSRTCMSCHSNKGEFCDGCHEYAGVKPYCWDCHLVPSEMQ